MKRLALGLFVRLPTHRIACHIPLAELRAVPPVLKATTV